MVLVRRDLNSDYEIAVKDEKKVVSRKQKRTMIAVYGENESNGAGAARSKLQSNCYRYNDEIAARDGNLKEKEKEKEKVSLAEGAAKIDFECLDITLRHISASYRRKLDLLRFVEWFGLSLSDVQFSWPEMFKDPRLFKLIHVIDVPFSYIPQLIYKRTSDWINEQSLGALCGFVWWAFDIIMDFLTALRGGPPRTPRISQREMDSAARRYVPKTLSREMDSFPMLITIADG